MPKLKTKKAAAKRFKKTGTGRVPGARRNQNKEPERNQKKTPERGHPEPPRWAGRGDCRLSRKEHREDALALRAEERRDKLRKAAGSCK